MIQANKVVYLSCLPDYVNVLMGKDGDSNTFSFYDKDRIDPRKLKVVVFKVAALYCVCYDLHLNGESLAEDTSNPIDRSALPGLIAAIVNDVYK